MPILRHETCQPWVRRVGSCLHSCPPLGPELSLFPFGEGSALVREGGFVQCQRAPNSYLWLVRMLLIHPYLIYIYIHRDWSSARDARLQHRLPYMETILQDCYTCVCTASARPRRPPHQFETILQVPSRSLQSILPETCNIVPIDGKDGCITW